MKKNPDGWLEWFKIFYLKCSILNKYYNKLKE